MSLSVSRHILPLALFPLLRDRAFLLSLHIFPFSLVFLVFTFVVVGFFGGTMPTLGGSLVFFLFLFHRLGQNRVSSIEYLVVVRKRFRLEENQKTLQRLLSVSFPG